MPDARFEIAYDGADLRGHSMDVLELAPALLALGNLIRDANVILNGERSRVKVLVQSDFEHKCFSVSFDVVQSIFDHAKALLDHKDTKTARELLEYLGLLGVPTLGGGVLGYLRWRKGRKVESTTTLTDKSGTGLIELKLNDGNTTTINQTIYLLGERPEIKKAIEGIIAPTLTPGIDQVSVREAGKEVTLVVTKAEAEDIRASIKSESVEMREIEHDPQPVVAHLRVRSATFDADAKQWRFYYGEEIIAADITETNIAANAMARGGVLIDDLYTVKLEITEHETASHQFRKSYKIKEVLDFKPASRQTDLFIQDRRQ